MMVNRHCYEYRSRQALKRSLCGLYWQHKNAKLEKVFRGGIQLQFFPQPVITKWKGKVNVVVVMSRRHWWNRYFILHFMSTLSNVTILGCDWAQRVLSWLSSPEKMHLTKNTNKNSFLCSWKLKMPERNTVLTDISGFREIIMPGVAQVVKEVFTELLVRYWKLSSPGA